MKSPRHYIENSLRIRTIDRILSSGLRKQLFCLILLAAFFWGVLLVITAILEIPPRDLFSNEPPIDKIENVSSCVQESTSKQIETSDELPLWWVVYYHFVDPGSQHLASPSARILVMIISFIGSIILTGLLISTFSNIIERRIDRYNKGLIRYNFSNHVILFGYSNMTAYLIKQLCSHKEYGRSTIVIQTSRVVEDIRMELYSELNTRERANIVFVYARRDMKDELESLRVDKAKEVFILGESYLENRAEYAHDSLNMDCLNFIGRICKEKGRKDRLKCNVLFEYQTTFSAFQFSDISKELKEIIEFYPFNFYENWAQEVFVIGKTSDDKVKYQPLDRIPIDVNSDKRVHLVVVGMSKMGIAMAIEAAHIAHFPNFKSKNKKTKITFIDLAADEEMNYVKTRYKDLFDLTYSKYVDINSGMTQLTFPSKKYSHLGSNFIDIEWEFIKGNVAHPEIQAKIDGWAKEQNDILTIAVCFNFPHTSISCALYLPDAVYRNNIPVLVLQRDSSAVIDNIAGLSLPPDEPNNLHYKNLRPFGMESDGFDLSTSDLLYAKRTKYVYDFFYDRNMNPVQMPTLNELNKDWYKEKVSNMWSNIYNANSIPTKLRSIGYTHDKWHSITSLINEQVGILSEVEHNRWNVEKLLVGFRPPTEEENKVIEKDIAKEKGSYKAKYIHYDIRPYHMLRPDGTGRNANEYDICITKALPLIIKA